MFTTKGTIRTPLLSLTPINQVPEKEKRLSQDSVTAPYRTHAWTSGMYWRNSRDIYILMLRVMLGTHA